MFLTPTTPYDIEVLIGKMNVNKVAFQLKF